jgi:hypothetical protein
MQNSHWTSWASLLGAATIVVALGAARAEVASDQPAAIVIYPYVTVDSANGVDTVIQLTNTSAEPVSAHCVYEEATRECASTFFFISLTPQQPIAWRVSAGRSQFPLDGNSGIGPGGSGNQGSLIPSTLSDPFTGSLECVAVDRNRLPLGRNVLVGTATVETRQTSPNATFDAAAYNAVGISAIAGARNTAGNLIFGGPSAEYNGCAQMLTLTHFFDGAIEPTTKSRSTMTRLILVPCGQDLASGTHPDLPPDLVVSYQVYNEFEQRFTTSRSLGCAQTLPLSLIDTADPMRSIFSVGVQGTLTGQTQVVGVGRQYSFPQGSGLVAVAVEVHQDLEDPTRTRTAISSVHSRGTRTDSDYMRLPGLPLNPECTGDCNYDSAVTVDEIVTGVNVVLGDSPLSVCPQLGRPWNPFDPNGDGLVTIDELLAAVNNAVAGCPTRSPAP